MDNGNRIMTINSPGGSTLQWVAGRRFVAGFVVALQCITRNHNGNDMHTLRWLIAFSTRNWRVIHWHVG